MQSSFLTNYSEERFIDRLKKNIDSCRKFMFSVSFIKKAGLRLISSNLEAALARGAERALITSTYYGIPYRTVQDWYMGKRKMPEYLLRLMIYKAEMKRIQIKKTK